MRQFTYVAEFSCLKESAIRFSKDKILKCIPHPDVIGDVLVTMITTPEEAFKLPFKSYTDKTDKEHGWLKITKVYDLECYKGKIQLD